MISFKAHFISRTATMDSGCFLIAAPIILKNLGPPLLMVFRLCN
jgi:hypothetical protein